MIFKLSYDLGKLVRCSRLGLSWANGAWLEGCPQVKCRVTTFASAV